MAKEFNEDAFKITENEKVYSGPRSEIDSVTLSSGEHSRDLLRKKFQGYSIEFMQGPEWHTALQKRGYPVLPTWRYDAENKVEYVTDLRQGGTHRVIDFCGGKGNYEKVHISNIEELKSDVEKLVTKAADDGLVINEPNVFFDVELDTGIAKVLLGDLREIGYGPDAETGAPREEVFAHNQSILNEHITRLENIME
ncbi:MAG: hypothetical protein Q7S84_00800 [bacterium]|nr:hypothetical protein [bacterium]